MATSLVIMGLDMYHSKSCLLIGIILVIKSGQMLQVRLKRLCDEVEWIQRGLNQAR